MSIDCIYPTTAQFPVMPQAAINTGSIQYILKLNEITNWLLEIPLNKYQYGNKSKD